MLPSGKETLAWLAQEARDAAAIAQHGAGESASIEAEVKSQLDREIDSLKWNGCRLCDGLWMWDLAWCQLPQYLGR